MANIKDFSALVAHLVNELPKDVIATHGTAEDLEQKIIDTVFPLDDTTPKEAEKKRGRGRPKGSKNKPKPVITGDEAPVTPKKKKGPAKVAPGAPKKHARSKDRHTRKSKKSTAAATRIQALYRGHTVRCE